MTHLDVTKPLDKKEHEISTLKRIGVSALRMGEPVGRKVIMVYDRAIFDFLQWYQWKRTEYADRRKKQHEITEFRHSGVR